MKLVQVASLGLCGLLLAGACGGDDDGGGGGDAIDAICTHYIECGVADSREECTAFFEKVFSDLEERCDNAAEVSELYRDSMRCVAEVSCEDLFMDGFCEDEEAAYDAAKAAGGETCEPDDD